MGKETERGVRRRKKVLRERREKVGEIEREVREVIPAPACPAPLPPHHPVPKGGKGRMQRQGRNQEGRHKGRHTWRPGTGSDVNTKAREGEQRPA